jgi:uncharacterized protein (TIGR03067 family)
MFHLVMASALVVAAPGPKDPPKPAPIPEGRWVVEQLEQDGRVRQGQSVAGFVLVYTRTACTLEHLGREIGSEPTEFREAAGVHQVDSRANDGVKKGIWKVDGDTLTLCESAPGGDRPADYSAPAGSRRTLWVLKRIKD